MFEGILKNSLFVEIAGIYCQTNGEEKTKNVRPYRRLKEWGVSDMRRFAIGDIHGNLKALRQCLMAVDFNFQDDLLISLGDICDGYPETPRCIDELMGVKNFVWVVGNHDLWCMNWISGCMTQFDKDWSFWINQGGMATRDAYLRNPDLLKKHHSFWLQKPTQYFRLDNYGFVHGGIIPSKTFAEHLPVHENTFYWDRDLFLTAKNNPFDKIDYAEGIDMLFVGHTQFKGLPIITRSLINLDTGAGWDGQLTIMDIDTKEYFQSDFGPILYPHYKHR